MSTKTTTVTTAHGDVEYESVTCSSCGTEITKENAKPFVIGDVRAHFDKGLVDKERFEFDSRTIRKGWACEYCYDDGPIDFPKWMLDRTVRMVLGIIAVSLSLSIFLTVLTIIL